MSIQVTHDWQEKQWDWPLQHNDGVVKVNNLPDRWEVGLDAQFFTPKEIEVKVMGDSLLVHCRHEGRSDEHGSISREVSRTYKLSPDVDTTSIKSHLTPQGVLHITAKKRS